MKRCGVHNVEEVRIVEEVAVRGDRGKGEILYKGLAWLQTVGDGDEKGDDDCRSTGGGEDGGREDS